MAGLAKRVLAIGAHPDDIEMTCAGTLARFRHAGSAVHLAVACRGDKGGSAASAEELAARREQEARRAAELLGAPITFLGLPDAEIRAEPRTRLWFIRGKATASSNPSTAATSPGARSAGSTNT